MPGFQILNFELFLLQNTMDIEYEIIFKFDCSVSLIVLQKSLKWFKKMLYISRVPII